LTFSKSFDGLSGMISFIYKKLNTILVEGKDVIIFIELLL